MYGTVARMRLKPGAEDQFRGFASTFEAANVPGSVATYVYRMDSAPNEYYMAVLFKDKTAYQANATSPEQNTRFLQMMELLEQEPEWHDGEIIYAGVYNK
jgi:quinol monooxygenase YgiN